MPKNTLPKLPVGLPVGLFAAATGLLVLPQAAGAQNATVLPNGCGSGAPPKGSSGLYMGPDGLLCAGAVFTPTGQASLAISNTSSRVALGSAGKTLVIWNSGTVDGFIALGGTTVAAGTTSFPVPHGAIMVYNNAAGAVDLAGITATGTTTLNITSGYGVPQIAVP